MSAASINSSVALSGSSFYGVNRLLGRLELVREIGAGRWIARCPAHEDRRPSLSIRGLEDGRILLHDFAGCSATDVVSAIGLELSDLFPERPTHYHGATRPNHFHAAREALQLQGRQALIVAIAAENLASGISLTDEDRALLLAAARRLRTTVEMVR